MDLKMLGLSKSERFAAMIRTQCRRFVVHDHGKDAAPPAEPGAAGDRGVSEPR